MLLLVLLIFFVCNSLIVVFLDYCLILLVCFGSGVVVGFVWGLLVGYVWCLVLLE